VGVVNKFFKAGINANYILKKNNSVSRTSHSFSSAYSNQLLLFREITAISNLQGSDDI
jgi:hypothetical protein